MDKFIQLVHTVFGDPMGLSSSIPSFTIPLLCAFRKFAFSYLTDSKYSARKIESALQSVLGVDRSLMEGGLEYPGKKFGVVATTIRGSVPCIFTNYTNVTSQLARYGYRLVKPKVDRIRIKLWEAWVLLRYNLRFILMLVIVGDVARQLPGSSNQSLLTESESSKTAVSHITILSIWPFGRRIQSGPTRSLTL